jgi:hypothetical protein
MRVGSEKDFSTKYDFNFNIVSLPFIYSNISAALAYVVYMYISVDVQNNLTKGMSKLISIYTDKISHQPENCENRNDPDLVQAFLKKWWVESDF